MIIICTLKMIDRVAVLPAVPASHHLCVSVLGILLVFPFSPLRTTGRTRLWQKFTYTHRPAGRTEILDFGSLFFYTNRPAGITSQVLPEQDDCSYILKLHFEKLPKHPVDI